MKKPWLEFYETVPANLEYPETLMIEEIEKAAKKWPFYNAWEFMGKTSSYTRFIADVDICAKALINLGVALGDKVTVCLPNTPHAIIVFYAINKIGAVANMVHPLSSAGEIEFYLNDAGSHFAITLNTFYPNFAKVAQNTGLKRLIICKIPDYLPKVKGVLFSATKGRKIAKIPVDSSVIFWDDFLKGAANVASYKQAPYDPERPAAILYSGGTTGVNKGIKLSNMNFNSLALQVVAMGRCITAGQKMLSVMPVFHGFGLGICIHAVLVHGVQALLIPQFNAKTYADLVLKRKPNYIAGVPTLFETMLTNKKMKNADLSCLKAIFVGGDSLTVELKHKFDAFLAEHNCKATLREGYGLTECVTGSCLTPINKYVEGSIGIPLPDMLYKIVKPGKQVELPYNSDGEICISGPTVMLGYVGQPEETAKTLQVHDDGLVWMHTGDMGMMDEMGFIYFRQRIKRMIITKGYNVYPFQIENTLDGHPEIMSSCVVGIPDKLAGERIKAFVVLKSGEPDSGTTKRIMDYLRTNVARYALPYDIEYLTALPKTKVNKVAYTKLIAEELLKLGIAGDVRGFDSVYAEEDIVDTDMLKDEE